MPLAVLVERRRLRRPTHSSVATLTPATGGSYAEPVTPSARRASVIDHGAPGVWKAKSMNAFARLIELTLQLPRRMDGFVCGAPIRRHRTAPAAIPGPVMGRAYEKGEGTERLEALSAPIRQGGNHAQVEPRDPHGGRIICPDTGEHSGECDHVRPLRRQPSSERGVDGRGVARGGSEGPVLLRQPHLPHRLPDRVTLHGGARVVRYRAARGLGHVRSHVRRELPPRPGHLPHQPALRVGRAERYLRHRGCRARPSAGSHTGATARGGTAERDEGVT
jgi:hypothetical protein